MPCIALFANSVSDMIFSPKSKLILRAHSFNEKMEINTCCFNLPSSKSLTMNVVRRILDPGNWYKIEDESAAHSEHVEVSTCLE